MAGTTLPTGCGTTEKSADQLACGLLNPAVVDEIADGRSWTAVGKLYRDGQFRDGRTVCGLGASPGARGTNRVGPQVSPDGPGRRHRRPGHERCVCEKQVDCAVWNPNRLVRVTLARRFGVVATTYAVAQVAASVNANADKIDQ